MGGGGGGAAAVTTAPRSDFLPAPSARASICTVQYFALGCPVVQSRLVTAGSLSGHLHAKISVFFGDGRHTSPAACQAGRTCLAAGTMSGRECSVQYWWLMRAGPRQGESGHGPSRSCAPAAARPADELVCADDLVAELCHLAEAVGEACRRRAPAERTAADREVGRARVLSVEHTAHAPHRAHTATHRAHTHAAHTPRTHRAPTAHTPCTHRARASRVPRLPVGATARARRGAAARVAS
eukprot:scaffold103054_cov78-Phaeocystis_antarctica.AAC.2